MKHLGVVPSRRLPAARLALCVILVAAATLALPAPARACGPGTHHEVVDRACDKLDRQAYPHLAAMVCDNRNGTYAGAVFVDWATAKNAVWSFGTQEYGTWSEAIHHDAFLDGYLHYLLDRDLCPPPAGHCKASLTDDERYNIAFLFGMIAHHEADTAFHGPIPSQHAHELLWPTKKASELTEGETCEPYKVNGVEVKGVCRIRGFLEEAMIRESTDHTGGESATEAFVNQFHGQIGNPPIGAWGFPADAIWHSYAAMTPPLYVCRSVIPTPLGDKVLDLSWWCESSGMNEQLASDEGQEVWSSKIVHVDYEINGQWQWIAENLVTWPVGGLDDMANHTLAAWLHYWDLLVGRPEVAGVTIAGPSEGEPGTYTFTAAFEPADASPPVGWLWDNGATKPVLTRELVEEGTYTLWVTATNYWGGPLAKTSHTIAVQDGEGEEPCPAGPELAANCDPEPPPYYAVVNGQQDCLERTGSACSPFVLGHPECTNCATCNVDVQSELCEPYLTGVVPEGQTETLYEMCQAGTRWLYRVRTLDSMGNCPLDDPNWSSDPPVTGVDLPAPLIVAGMALLGVCFLGLGAVVRRKVVC